MRSMSLFLPSIIFIFAFLLSLAICATEVTSIPLKFGSPSWRSPDHVCYGPPEVYTVRRSPGKGLGVFAMHDLDIGSLIMSEAPILEITPPKLAKAKGYPIAAIDELVRIEFLKLSPMEQAVITNLTYHATAAEQESANNHKLGLILRSNAYNTGEKFGLFPKIARINHSCRPNTSYYWDPRRRRRVVYANRRIEAGEELSVSYISLLLPREERHRLLDQYGFACRCETCMAKTEEGDMRRVAIKKALIGFDPRWDKGAVPETKAGRRQARKNVEASLQLVELVKQEGLADYYGNAYRVAAISHARLQDWKAATIWANRGYERRVMENPGSPYTAEMYQLTSEFIENWKKEVR